MDPLRKLLALALATGILGACGGQRVSQASPSTETASPSPAPSSSPVGPGGLTLDQEIGAVMMVGFQGPLTPAVLADWKRHQYGGLLVVNLNHNASTAQQMSSLIEQI